MSIRVVDGSDTTRQGFEALGLDADEMAAKFAAGGDSAKEAFQQTIEALDAMEDPLAPEYGRCQSLRDHVGRPGCGRCDGAC